MGILNLVGRVALLRPCGPPGRTAFDDVIDITALRGLSATSPMCGRP
jgi:hypothetical protein